MIKHEDFKTICKRDDYVDISMDIKEIIERKRWNVVAAPAGYGKTTILSMLYYYLDIDEDSEELFSGSELSINYADYKTHLNKYIVLSLVIIMDTLDVLLGYTRVTDDSLLLSDSDDIWGILDSAKCWEDVNKKYARYYKNKDC